MTANARIASIEIDEKSLAPAGPDAEHERKVAIFDLIESNSFKVLGHEGGPYNVVLSLADNRLVFDILEQNGSPVRKLLLSLTALRRVIKDYFMICDSYYDAIRSSSPSQIEAIDMGRRGIHNEAAEIVIERLQDKVTIDFQTARRIFTLLAALSWTGRET